MSNKALKYRLRLNSQSEILFHMKHLSINIFSSKKIINYVVVLYTRYMYYKRIVSTFLSKLLLINVIHI